VNTWLIIFLFCVILFNFGVINFQVLSNLKILSTGLLYRIIIKRYGADNAIINVSFFCKLN